jgi:hypothetical protein
MTELNVDRETMGKREIVKMKTANVLLPGDRVNLDADTPGTPYGWATVIAVSENYVELVRPYIHVSDTQYSGVIAGQNGTRLIDYVGQENIKLDRLGKRVLHVVFRSLTPA